MRKYDLQSMYLASFRKLHWYRKNLKLQTTWNTYMIHIHDSFTGSAGISKEILSP